MLFSNVMWKAGKNCPYVFLHFAVGLWELHCSGEVLYNKKSPYRYIKLAEELFSSVGEKNVRMPFDISQ